ncbi:MAG: hypothetical protein KGH69_04280 [Candidatus Micrarchaeota archaeon]|nr:hypothetical protein [Candidatus Micrarchaeota archaeon]
MANAQIRRRYSEESLRSARHAIPTVRLAERQEQGGNLREAAVSWRDAATLASMHGATHLAESFRMQKNRVLRELTRGARRD